MSELIKVKQDCAIVKPENITEGLCTQDGISSHLDNHCNEQQQLCISRQEGEILEWCYLPNLFFQPFLELLIVAITVAEDIISVGKAKYFIKLDLFKGLLANTYH